MAAKTPPSADKAKALQSAMQNIQKQFGKGSIMLMGEEDREAVETISTGSLLLNRALGIGGLPKGRVVEIYGPESSGKCLTADTYAWTERGLETFGEIFESFGQDTSATPKVTDIRDEGFSMVNARNELEDVAALTHNGLRQVFAVTLSSGRKIKGTCNHPLRVVNASGQVVWRKMGAMEQGDIIVSALFGSEVSATCSSLSEPAAVLLGYLISDGLPEPTPIWVQEAANEYRKIGDSGSAEDVLSLLADKYGLDSISPSDAAIPRCVRTASHKARKAFLSALFESPSSSENDGAISYFSASETLAREVQLLLYGFGIQSDLRSKKVAGYEADYWELILGLSASAKFAEDIGFRSERRRSRWDGRDECARSKSSGAEGIPSPLVAHLVRSLRDHVIGDREIDNILSDLLRSDMSLRCSRGRLEKIVAWFDGKRHLMLPPAVAVLETLRFFLDERYTFEEVVSVTDEGMQPTFDVAMGETHSFVANGILSHNTTLTLQTIAECQKAGGVCAFIDAEHAMDPVYAANLGVDIPSLLLSQPDTGEQALEIADMLVRSGAVDLIVIDSVAALTPRAEIEGEMGDQLPGLQARLMSQALRKITGNISRSNCTVIFINQLRMKIGVMMPGQSPETTTGGNALKFYSSVRLDIRRIGAIKKGDEIIGNQTRIKVVKNKMAPPFRQAVTEIIYGQGISREGELIELGVEYGILGKTGSWYEFNGSKIANGKEAVRKELQENKALASAIEEQVTAKMDAEVSGKKAEKTDEQ